VHTYGEQDVVLNSTRVGRLRVLGVFATAAIFPSLGIRLGVQLEKLQRTHAQDPTPEGELQLRDLSGELRLMQFGDAIGSLRWTGRRHGVRSGSFEIQIELACDLDPWRVSRIEAHRDGQSPQLWLQLSPVLLACTEWHDADVPAFAISISREEWLAILEKWGVARYAILEVPCAPMDVVRFHRAIEHLTDCRHAFVEGRFNESVAQCRLAIDAAFFAVDAEEGERKGTLGDRISDSVPDERKKEYATLLGALKELTNDPHHTSRERLSYLRSEAAFILHVTEHLLALFGALCGTGGKPRLPLSDTGSAT